MAVRVAPAVVVVVAAVVVIVWRCVCVCVYVCGEWRGTCASIHDDADGVMGVVVLL
jgi:hypothetical protein